jgi:hypothetical protein
MLRANSLKNLHQKRTIRPLYHWNSAVPYACFVDTSSITASTVVVPGMVASKTTGEMMRVANATTVPFGLFDNFIHGDMDEIGDGTEISVWRGGGDATFEVLAGPDSSSTPLDPTVTWTSLNATAGGVLLYSNASGQLTNVDGGSVPVARLVEAVSNAKIVVNLIMDAGVS